MKKIKEFMIDHKIMTVLCFLVLICAIAGGKDFIDQYREQQQFYTEHPLVNKVYKYHFREKPYSGPWTEGTFYYIFGNQEHRNEVVTVYQHNGGIKRVKEILNNKDKYNKEFSDRAEKYIVKDGNKLIIGTGDLDDGYSHQIKKGENWIGSYDSNDKNEELPGEIHKATPVNID
ncbi:hypothetical protein [Limosilactobacillus reuteri]|uniref:hypothetical protein n=1 Tax=Limosilactobacillus reuteri TaxID=1598 RepID=UPI002B0588DB|nr:hypothetical protein [Limosilactobacillus reuteri]